MSKIISKGHKTWKDGSVMTYAVTDDGVMTISGSLRDGRLVPFKSKAPFYHVVIADGVGSVGKENFKGLDELEELTLPPSVKEIGKEAFSYCRNLRRIHFSEGLTAIGEEAFRGCVHLSGLRFPETLTKLWHGAFMSCDALEKICLPKGIELGGSDFCGCDSLKEVVLPKGLQRIPDGCFDCCDALESIKIPESVRYIGDWAFRCDKLKDIMLPKSDVLVGKTAFGKEVKCEIKGEGGMRYNCTIYNIKTDKAWASICPAEKLEGKVIVPSHVEYEGKSYPVTIIESNAFSGMGIKTVTLPDTVVEIEDSAFENCEHLREVYLGKSLQRIGNSAFNRCKWLVYMPMPASVMQVGYEALDNTRMVETKNGVIYFGHILYGYRGYLPEHSYIEVRKGTTVIADSAFYCRVYRRFFSRDFNNLEGIILPAGIKRIGDSAFLECKNLTYVNLPKSLEYIGSSAFGGANVQEVRLPWKKPIEKSINSFTRDAVIHIPKGAMETERYILDGNGVLTFKDDVTMINDEEFEGRNDIKKIVFPGTVDHIGNSAFFGCKSLREIVLQDGLRVIWEYAFSGCGKLKKIQFPASVEHICSSAFSCCKGLKEAVVHSNTLMGDHVFSDCGALKKVIIRDVKPSASAK